MRLAVKCHICKFANQEGLIGHVLRVFSKRTIFHSRNKAQRYVILHVLYVIHFFGNLKYGPWGNARPELLELIYSTEYTSSVATMPFVQNQDEVTSKPTLKITKSIKQNIWDGSGEKLCVML
jgi:hypothetical protein